MEAARVQLLNRLSKEAAKILFVTTPAISTAPLNKERMNIFLTELFYRHHQ